jgi:dipeptidyl aminopeptidase/acylaminoacyl peptidase
LVCRIDTVAFKEYARQQETTSTSKCVCSSGCQFLFRATTLDSWHASINTEFPIPKMNHKMKLGGLAIAKDGTIWTQSYVDAGGNPEELPDYVLKLGLIEHDGTNTHEPNRSSVVSMTGVPFVYYELPKKDTILHPIAIDPYQPDDQADERVWFTDLGADRILARQRIAVIKVDNRGSFRRGLVFEAPVYGNRGELEVADQVADVEWAVGEGIADKERVAVSGWSCGG